MLRGCRLSTGLRVGILTIVWGIGIGGFGSFAQADAVKLKNGSEIVGEILLETPKEVMIKTSSGILTYSKKEVQSTRRFKLRKRPVPTPTPTPIPEAKETPKVPGRVDAKHPRGPEASKSTTPPSRIATETATGPVRNLGTCQISIPNNFKPVQKSELPPEALGKAQNLGEFLDAATGTRVIVTRLDLPEGLPPGTLEPLLWQNFQAMSQSDPRVSFKQGKVGPHRAILGDLTSNESGQLRKVLSAYVFGHPKGIHVVSVSALPAVAVRDAKQFDKIRRSLKLSK